MTGFQWIEGVAGGGIDWDRHAPVEQLMACMRRTMAPFAEIEKEAKAEADARREARKETKHD